MRNVLEKPKSFYTTFDRKASADKVSTHYCPGCGHGVVHKYVAEAIDELELADRTIFLSPVGCSVFAYYYFDTGNIQCAHGRAPAVGTGVSRAAQNAVVISYQGDGDLAAIGGNEILHAANRGERMAVIFINNGIYGMTGGQLAPTSQLGQVTMTTPRGRDPQNDGYPMRMAEIIATLEAPVYVERVMIADPKSNNHALKAIKKALRIQKERQGFAFVEVLSACPTGWKLTPEQALRHIRETITKYYQLGVLKDETTTREPRPLPAQVHPKDEIFNILGLARTEANPVTVELTAFPEQRIRVAGFGGQGVMMAGTTLTAAGMARGLHVSWLPSYGPEMRGGTANCHVIIARDKIGSPLASEPNVLIAMNQPSLDTFEPLVEPGGLVLVNSSIVNRRVERDDVRAVYLPVTEVASDLGLKNAANMVALGAYVTLSGCMDTQALIDILPKVIKRSNVLEVNLEAIRKGSELARAVQG